MIDLNKYYIAKTYDGVSGNYAGRPGFVPQATTGDAGKFLRADGSWADFTGVDLSNYYTKDNPSGFITGVDLSSYITTSQTGIFYPASNPSGFITGVNLSSYITTSQTGAFYAASNPNGYITGIDLSNYVTKIGGEFTDRPTVNGTGVLLSGEAASLPDTIVYTTGDQDISGLKDFQARPTVTDIPVLLSGDPVDLIHLYGKNDEASTIYKGQPVYIGGANGTNPLIKIASNTGERTSSKTIGLLAQDLLVNEFGYVITEGTLEGFNTSAGTAGDPIWLGPTGSLIFGTGNKPYAPNHLVYLGVVLRSNQNNGKVYVRTQNGYEVDELHNVVAKNPQNRDALLYNSASGLWISRQLINSDLPSTVVYTTGDQTISGNKNFVGDIYIKNLFVTGTETIVSTTNFNVQSPYLLLNLTGGAVDGGIFFVTGSGLTGINDYGPIIGFDHSNKFKFGIARRSDDLSILNDIAAVQDITNYSGFVNGNFYPINNPSGYITGIDLSNYYTNDNPSGFITGIQKETKLFDYVTTGIPIYMYVGSAPFGSSQNDNIWDIYRTEIDQNGLVVANLLATNVAWTGRFLENYM